MTALEPYTWSNSIVVFFMLVMTINGLPGNESCPLWHVMKEGKCSCVSTLRKQLILCSEDILLVSKYMCLTWNKESDSVRASYCLFVPVNYTTMSCKREHYYISTKLSGPELNKWICGKLNRQGAQCKQCVSGYGPAALSDGVSCADCSKHKHMWFLNLLLQLLLLTITFVMIMVLQIKGTASPWNIIITYSQLVVNALMYDTYLRNHIQCYIGKKVTLLLITVLGVSNLDFFRLIIPPMCISPTLKAVNALLFDYIIALYPILMIMLVYALIELHDRNCMVVAIASMPLRKLYHCFQGRWNPKQSILSTFATFLLLLYSKLLFVSCNFLVTVQSYNSTGDPIPNSNVLLYDPSIRYFKPEHTPYIIIALSVIILFILLPPLLMLLYPVHLFRKIFTYCGFRRLDILHMIMDTFQGWYKDGTEGTYDYRPLSALYMLLRVGLVGEFLAVISQSQQSRGEQKWITTICFHVLLGSFFLITKPYKKHWMNVVDGLILIFFGLSCYIYVVIEVYY